MPMLDAADDVDAQLPIVLECVFPVRRDFVRKGEQTGDAPDHHLAHFIVCACVGIDVLYPP